MDTVGQRPVSVGSPTPRAVDLATAYQATDPSRPAVVTVNVTSTATLSIAGGTTIIGEVRIGSTSSVASGGGTAVGSYRNSLTGTLTIGLNTSTQSVNAISFILPTGHFFAILQTSGAGMSVSSAFDQPLI